MRAFAYVLFLSALTGCDAVSNYQNKFAAEAVVRRNMRDPASTEFRSEAVHEYKMAPYLCGEVNSANGYGGKVGFRRFFANSAKFDIDPTDGSFSDASSPQDLSSMSNEELENRREASIFEMKWLVICEGANRPLPAE